MNTANSALVAVRMFLEMYEVLGEDGRNSRRADVVQKFSHLRRILQVYWLQVRNELRSTPRPTNSDQDALAMRRTFGDFTERWERLGRLYSLSTKSREEDQNLTAYVLPMQKSRGCFWAECTCYGRRPQHEFRRVCKGCWGAFYCGPRCQAR